MDKVCIYCRVAYRDPDGLDFALKHQQERLEQFAREQGHTVVSTVAEYGSGNNAKRPGLCKVMEGARAGEFDTILVTSLGRLQRDFISGCKIICDLKYKYGVEVYSQNDAGDAQLPFECLYDAYKRDLSQRIRAGIWRKKEAARSTH